MPVQNRFGRHPNTNARTLATVGSASAPWKCTANSELLGRTPEAVPRSVLGECLNPLGATTLEPSIRRFMEDRFRKDFGDLRIHTRPAAAALCEALRARALTWGRDIAFAAGQYDPAGETGRRLLAHELVHFLQQRSAARPASSAVVPVGDPLDDCEAEAVRLAEQALSGSLREVVTPDAANVIRRITFDSVELKIDKKGSKPTIFVQPQGASNVDQEFQGSAVCHLNRREFQNNEKFFHPQTEAEMRAISAINVKGSVVAKIDTGDDIINWRFRFIQVARIVSSIVDYVGCEKGHGSVRFDLADPDVFDGAGKYLLDSAKDSDSPLFPYIVDREEKTTARGSEHWLVSNDMDDHPTRSHVLLFHNVLTDKPNFLFQVNRSIRFISAFVAEDSGNAVKILAHVPWEAQWSAFFNWPNGSRGQPTPSLIEKISKLDVGQWVKGPPNDNLVVDTITNAHKSDPNKTIDAVAENAESKIGAQMRAFRAQARRQNKATFGDAIQVSKSWPPFYESNPGLSGFCGSR